MITKERREEIKELVVKLSTDSLEFSASLSEKNDYRELRKMFVTSACTIGSNFWRMGSDPDFAEIGETARVCRGKAIRLGFLIRIIEEMKLSDPSELNHLKVQLEVLSDEFQKYVNLE
ncbi:MAG: hypothetical protein CMP59_09970 [Flavobacteriales bacterium]|nr:hypothetical protein [Flavobacteriales bacterium]|tara:strand:+ start:348 stop:701 length:354 start_codon:yes stop_codon:yes gene_type:complete